MSTQQPGSHFWLMTVQTAQDSRGGHRVVTLSGTFTPAPGQSRQDAYEQLVRVVARETGTDQNTVLFFSLDPNRL